MDQSMMLMRATAHAKDVFRAYAEYALDVTGITVDVRADGVPSTGKAIYAAYLDARDHGATFPVLADVENTSLWGRVSNENYRLAHDIDHAWAYENGEGGTTKLEDELKLNKMWIARALNPCVYGQTGEGVRTHAAALLAADLLGQAVWYSQTGTFVSDQKAFTLAVYKRLLADCGTLHALHMRVLDILKTPMLISEYL